ncbi:MAG: UDP-3-O-(3-hydroxymyristoyl)glucosamine N-acyltransferase [Chlamydiota bacterium]
MKKHYTLSELANLTSTQLMGDPQYLISGVNTLDDANPQEASFLANIHYVEAMKRSKAGVICLDPKQDLNPSKNYLISEDPSRSFQKLVEIFSDFEKILSGFSGIHPSAILHPSAKIGKECTIGPYAVIDKGVIIGDHSFIGSHVYIGPFSSIGHHCTIHPSVVIRERTIIKDSVVLQPGAIIGSCGFGFTINTKGQFIKLDQIGNVIIEDDVEIGANTTIDRARFRATTIKKNTKIDNLVQIAHNVEIGESNAIAAQTGIAGSSKTGKYVMMGGQVGIVGHVEIADHTEIATRSGISKILPSGKYRGSPAMPFAEYNRQKVHVRRLEEYAKRIEALEEKVKKLKEPE